MNQFVTGSVIRRLREKQNLTQAQLAEKLGVSAKAVSRWETGTGYPDITLLEPIAYALHISVIELLSGEDMVNSNRGGNVLKTRFYVCPVCGNVITSTGEAVVSCCGITLPPLETDPEDEEHHMELEKVEDETYVTLNHSMTKEHYISFLAYVNSDTMNLVRLYPEGSAEARFKIRGHGWLYCFCNHHGLFRKRV